MESQQVTFGRRGGRKPPPAAAPAAAAVAASGHRLEESSIEPDFVVHRSVARMMMYFSIFFVLVFLMAGSKKHSPDLPFWMRPAAEFDLRDYGPTVLILIATFLVMIVPMILRPVALTFYPDHLVFTPILGRTRVIAWADISEITKSNWERGRWVNVYQTSGPRLSFQTNALELSADDLIERMNICISQAGRRNLRLSGEPINGQYLLPGH